MPRNPPLYIITDIFPECILIAFMSFIYNVSLVDYYSKWHRYEINSNQELLAYGAANIFSSFFYCFPSGASSSRTNIQSKFKGKTQVLSIFKLIHIHFTLCIILWIDGVNLLFDDRSYSCFMGPNIIQSSSNSND